MNRRLRRSAALAGGALAFAAGAAPAAHAQIPGFPSQGPQAYAATANGKLVKFPLASPIFATSRTITGLTAGDKIVGIDERPVNGALYAVTKGTGNAGRVYTINTSTGQATLAFALVAPGRTTAGGAATAIALSGTQFGVDFNPVADALRIVSDTGQNLRALPSDRVVATVSRFAGDTFTDGSLSYQPITAMPRAIEQGVNSAAYTNNDADPATTTTTLYDIDAASQRDLVTQAPPNDGTLTKVADLDIGVQAVEGFDIRGASEAYVLLGGVRFNASYEGLLLNFGITPLAVPVQLYALDLATGALTKRGLVNTSSPAVGFTVDIPGPAN